MPSLPTFPPRSIRVHTSGQTAFSTAVLKGGPALFPSTKRDSRIRCAAQRASNARRYPIVALLRSAGGSTIEAPTNSVLFDTRGEKRSNRLNLNFECIRVMTRTQQLVHNARATPPQHFRVGPTHEGTAPPQTTRSGFPVFSPPQSSFVIIRSNRIISIAARILSPALRDLSPPQPPRNVLALQRRTSRKNFHPRDDNTPVPQHGIVQAHRSPTRLYLT